MNVSFNESRSFKEGEKAHAHCIDKDKSHICDLVEEEISHENIHDEEYGGVPNMELVLMLYE